MFFVYVLVLFFILFLSFRASYDRLNEAISSGGSVNPADVYPSPTSPVFLAFEKARFFEFVYSSKPSI